MPTVNEVNLNLNELNCCEPQINRPPFLRFLFIFLLHATGDYFTRIRHHIYTQREQANPIQSEYQIFAELSCEFALGADMIFILRIFRGIKRPNFRCNSLANLAIEGRPENAVFSGHEIF